VLLNAHGGNENALRTISDELTPRMGMPIVQLTYWYAAAPAIAKILESQGALMHACEAETSMMMVLRPELVAKDRIPPALSSNALEMPGGVYRWRTIGSRSATGVIGDPAAATADKGERLLAAISDALADKLGNTELWAMPWQSDRLP
jgi:creatinine amidohydrolase